MVKAKPSMSAAIGRGGLAGIGTHEELEEYMHDEHGIAVSPTLREIPVENAKKAMEGIEQVLNEFPEIADSIDTVTYRAGGGSVHASNLGNGTILLRGTFGDSAESLAEYKDPGIGGDAATITAHEMGHTLERAMIRTAIAKGDIDDGYYGYVNAWNKNTMATKVVGEACRNVKKTDYGFGKTNAELRRGVSYYAGYYKGAAGNREALAECVMDYVTNGAGANPLSIEVVRVAKNYL